MAVLLAILGAGLTMLVLRLMAAAQARQSARAGWFDLVPLQDRLRAVMPTGFARVSGRMGGMMLDLQAVPDTLTLRKLPALWLLVTVAEPLPLKQRIDIMTRPRGFEPFSTIETLPHQTNLPPDFPADAILRSERPLSLREAALLHRHRRLFDDPRVKELVLSPKGIRIVWLAEEASRSRYLLFREAEMGLHPLDPAVLRPLVAALGALRQDLTEGLNERAA